MQEGAGREPKAVREGEIGGAYGCGPSSCLLGRARHRLVEEKKATRKAGAEGRGMAREGGGETGL